MHDSTAKDLPESASTADVATFERVFSAYSDPLCRFVYSYVGAWETAEDLVDDVFFKLWERLRHGDSVRDLKAYLFTTARNHAISHLRHLRVESRHRDRELLGERENEAIPAAVEQQLIESELTAALQRAVDLLPPRQRDVVLLKWRTQSTNEEIAQTLGIASTTVAEHFRRALQQLRASLPSLGDWR